jgi:hypothetical protein
VPVCWHSAKKSLSSARSEALGKVNILIFNKSLLSATSRALSKEVELNRQLLLLLAHSLTLNSQFLTAPPPHRARRRPRARPRRRPRARTRPRARPRTQPRACHRRRPRARPLARPRVRRRPRARARRRRHRPRKPSYPYARQFTGDPPRRKPTPLRYTFVICD